MTSPTPVALAVSYMPPVELPLLGSIAATLAPYRRDYRAAR